MAVLYLSLAERPAILPLINDLPSRSRKNSPRGLQRPPPKAEPPPPASLVSAAEPAPLAPERKEVKAPAEAQQQIAASAKKGAAPAAAQATPVSVPAPPSTARRGFTSSEKPGKVLSPQEVVKMHAGKAFDDLEREEQKHAH